MLTEYMVVNTSNIADLESEVDGYLADNWKLIGGFSYADGLFCQAMTRTYKSD